MISCGVSIPETTRLKICYRGSNDLQQLFLRQKILTIPLPFQENINEVKLPMEWRQHIYLILKEAINNLVKYSEATLAGIRSRLSGTRASKFNWKITEKDLIPPNPLPEMVCSVCGTGQTYAGRSDHPVIKAGAGNAGNAAHENQINI